MRRLCLLVVLSGPLAPPAWAAGGVGVVRSMTPESVTLALGVAQAGRPPRYQLHTPQLWVEFDTPYLRLVRKAAAACAQQQPVDESLATPDVTAPELHLSAGPEPMGDSVPEVKGIYIEGPDGTRVVARSAKKTVDYAQSVRRKKIALRGVDAIFPIEALVPGARFRVVLSQGPEQVLDMPPDWFSFTR